MHCPMLRIAAVLALAPLLFAQSRPSPASQLRALQEEVKIVRAAQRAEQEKARQQGESRPRGSRDASNALVARSLAHAKEHAGTDAALPFLGWALENSVFQWGLWEEVTATLVRDHIDSARLTDPLHWIGVFRLAVTSDAI